MLNYLVQYKYVTNNSIKNPLNDKKRPSNLDSKCPIGFYLIKKIIPTDKKKQKSKQRRQKQKKQKQKQINKLYLQ